MAFGHGVNDAEESAESEPGSTTMHAHHSFLGSPTSWLLSRRFVESDIGFPIKLTMTMYLKLLVDSYGKLLGKYTIHGS